MMSAFINHFEILEVININNKKTVKTVYQNKSLEIHSDHQSVDDQKTAITKQQLLNVIKNILLY